MEIALPLVALSGLYLINNQNKKSNNKGNGADNRGTEGFNSNLPNTNIPDKNYPNEYDIVQPGSPDIERTASLTVNNKFENAGGVYTDKYFTPSTGVYGGSDITSATSSSSKYMSLTGDTVDSKYFAHNNMVPFFGSNIRNQKFDNNAYESTLDSMNGSGSQYINKREQSPLFAAQTNLQWANGMPAASDFIQSRMNVGTRMHNVKPFQEEQVGPGVGLGFGTQGSGGYNSSLYARDLYGERSVDELRVANKQKASGIMMLGHEGPAMSKVVNRGYVGAVEKNRPERTFEWGEDRYFTTTGAEKGPAMHAIPVLHDQARIETTTSYSGIAGAQNSNTYTTGQYMPSTNIELGAVPFSAANAVGRGYANDSDFEMKAKVAYPNNRTENSQANYFGSVGGAIGAVVAPLLDILRPSRKENSVGTLRPYQNARGSVPESYLFNPADRPAPTIRETTENSKNHLNINSGQRGGAYEVVSVVPHDTIRQTTGDFYYSGIASSGDGTKQARVYDAEYNQRNNDIKSSTIQGYMVQGNMNLFNGNVNVTSKAKEGFLMNNRDIAPTMPYQSPDAMNVGQLQKNGYNNYSGISVDRNNGDVLECLNSNPYAMTISKRL
jgi:hypothetical protein